MGVGRVAAFEVTTSAPVADGLCADYLTELLSLASSDTSDHFVWHLALLPQLSV